MVRPGLHAFSNKYFILNLGNCMYLVEQVFISFFIYFVLDSSHKLKLTLKCGQWFAVEPGLHTLNNKYLIYNFKNGI